MKLWMWTAYAMLIKNELIKIQLASQFIILSALYISFLTYTLTAFYSTMWAYKIKKLAEDFFSGKFVLDYNSSRTSISLGTEWNVLVQIVRFSRYSKSTSIKKPTLPLVEKSQNFDIVVASRAICSIRMGSTPLFLIHTSFLRRRKWDSYPSRSHCKSPCIGFWCSLVCYCIGSRHRVYSPLTFTR